MSAAAEKPVKKRWRRRALWAVVGIVVLDQLLFWTLLTRPAGAIGKLIERTGTDEAPYFELRPGLSATYESWGRGNVTGVHTNALGLRDPARAAEKGEKRRVLVTGDSIAFGIGVEDEEAFPRQMERQLAERGATDIEVWNAGVPGYAMADHLGFLRRKLLSLKPDVIVLQLSRNDAAVPMPLSDRFMTATRYSGLARVWMIYRFNFVEDGALFRESLTGYLEECRRAGVKLIVAYEGLPEGRAEVLKTLADAGVPAIEIGGDAYPKLPDDPHYNAEGNRRVAERLLPEVLSALGR
ncbi:MAG: SGNH/GDSL hydrolase family protein [Polyangiaceae bacterium]